MAARSRTRRKDALDRLPADARRATPPALPEMNEPDVVRHYVNLSQLNFAVDTGFYPLGSCTMKFNPKLNEWAARLPGFAELHPMAPDEVAQGSLQLLWELEQALAEISGMRAVTLQPAAGAQGELTGILMIRAYHRERGDLERDEVLVPDSSHGTNPATASMAGYRTITIPSAPDGGVDIERFTAALGPRTAAVMITNPSTLGLFESRIGELLERGPRGRRAGLHGRRQPQRDPRPVQAGRGGLRRDALQRPQDVQHAPWRRRPGRRTGRGGGAAAAVPADAAGPAPRTTARSDWNGPTSARARSAGCAASSATPGVLVRAYAYIRAHGGSGLREVSDDAVLAANYLKSRLAGTYDLPYDRPCKHEFVASAASIKARTGVRTLDIAKRLIDFGFHPPTIYFPLIVEEGMLIEPTETELVETLDAFADALIAIAAEAETRPGRRSRAHRTRRRSSASTRPPRPASRTSAGGPMAGARDALPGLRR